MYILYLSSHITFQMPHGSLLSFGCIATVTVCHNSNSKLWWVSPGKRNWLSSWAVYGKKSERPILVCSSSSPYLHPAYSIMATVRWKQFCLVAKVHLQICMLPNNSQIYCNCFYILIWQPVATSMKCLCLFRYHSIYSKINRFWVKDAIQAPSCSVEVVVWKLGLVWLALVTGREGGGDNKHRQLQIVLARHLLLCYTNYAQNYHGQTNIVWLSVVVAMLHKLYRKPELGTIVFRLSFQDVNWSQP